jgi:hypothetical protein
MTETVAETGESSEMGADQRDRLLAAAEQLRDSHAGQVAVSASRLVNPLLDIWALAIEVGPDAAAPVEQLLTVYAGPRELASASELDQLVSDLRAVTEHALV